MSTDSTELLTKDCVTPDVDLQNYKVNTERKSTTAIPLCVMLNRESTTVYDIMRWETQIVECIRHCYMVSSRCPTYIDPLTIKVNENKNIVDNTVVRELFIDRYASSILLTDVVTRVHSSIFQCISRRVINNPDNIQIKILSVLGIYFYSSAAISSTKFGTSKICKCVSQFYDMIDSGLLEALSNIFRR